MLVSLDPIKVNCRVRKTLGQFRLQHMAPTDALHRCQLNFCRDYKAAFGGRGTRANPEKYLPCAVSSSIAVLMGGIPRSTLMTQTAFLTNAYPRRSLDIT